jgi:hypothetical protein
LRSAVPRRSSRMLRAAPSGDGLIPVPCRIREVCPPGPFRGR